MSKQTKIHAKKLTAAAANANISSPEVSPPADQARDPDDTEALILKVSESFSAAMEEKLSVFSEALDKIATKLEGHTTRINDVEQRVSNTEDTVDDLAGRLAAAEKKITLMANSLDDMENRSRRDNIRIINFKEGAEGSNPLQFFETWLPAFLGLDKGLGPVTSRIKMDRAHRGLGPQSARPRPVIIKLHNSRDKQRIMAAVKAVPELKHDRQRIYIHQDLSAAVREKRSGFNDVCRALIGKGICFNMRYPATLTLTHGSTVRKFFTPRDAQAFIDTLN
uniref:LINE-1 type transposase domain-containing 1 n=1 Tax=Knipowitschia caucasica TaxID=637954 RepID=A0AAV2JEB1_KNICA